MALGAACGVDTLSVPVKSRGSFGFGLSHLGRPQERWHRVAQELVAMTTIDAVAAALRLDRLDFVKADIEGWELALLRGGEQTLRRFRPVLLIELLTNIWRAPAIVEDAFALLGELGYTAFELDRRGRVRSRPRDGEYWFIWPTTRRSRSAKLADFQSTRAGARHDPTVRGHSHHRHYSCAGRPVRRLSARGARRRCDQGRASRGARPEPRRRHRPRA